MILKYNRRSSSKRGSAKHDSPKRGSPKHDSPKRGSPKRGSPKRGSQKRSDTLKYNRKSSKRGSVTRGWSNEKPSRHERVIMLQNCGHKCFLGPGTSFPICKRNTCKISQRGIHSAYNRARQWKYDKVASKASSLMK